MKKTQKVFTATILAFSLLSVSLLAGCGDTESTISTEEEEENSEIISEIVSEEEESEEYADQDTDEVSEEVVLGKIDSIEGDVLTVTLYESDTDSVDYLTVDVDTLTLGEESEVLDISIGYDVYILEDGEEILSDAGSLCAGDSIAIIYSTEQGSRIVLIREAALEEESETAEEYTLSEVTEISEEGIVTASVYAFLEDSTETTGAMPENLADWAWDAYGNTYEETQYEISWDADIMILSDGEIITATEEDMDVGDMLLVYTSAEGVLTYVIYPAEVIAENE